MSRHPTELENLLSQAEAAASGASVTHSAQGSARRVLELRPELAQVSAPPSTCCAECTSALWQIGPDGPQGYCRQMHALVWTSTEQNHWIDCGGLYLKPDQD